ncbi:MAG TPA: hypothetical protein VGP96_04875 [Candidatus Dormibacteraeota bacterium]|jgi:hypothetical protein|nr:hypothetical protein [Candidatus Dormibacteraeota bacterium]
MGVFDKLQARMKGEVSAEPLQAYRRAGAAVDALMADVDQRRVDATLAGRTAWTVDRSAQVEALCAWCAFVLQQLGDATLDAHEARHPGGFVSEQTSAQVTAYYRGVQDWVRRGHEAETSPAYRIDVKLPAELPGPAGAWREKPLAHLEGMRRVADTAGIRAEAAARELLEQTDPREHPGSAETIQELLARARASAQYAEQMWSSDPPERLRADLEKEVLAALTAYHRLGQLVALPELIAAQQAARRGR